MKTFKRIAVFLLVILIGMQLIRSKKNNAAGPFPNNIATVLPLPDSVGNILKKSCYDCHSNNTRYPWYSSFQPVSGWLNHHIAEGKDEVNFDEFATYKIGRQYRKLLEIKEQLEKDEMPLSSYTLIHSDAKLNEAEKKLITNWAESLRSMIRAKYPADSLVGKRPPPRVD